MKLTAALFEPHVGEDIIVHLDDGTPFPLKLENVNRATGPTAQGPDTDAADCTVFSLGLAGPPQPVIKALTYPMTLPGHDPIHLFISPHAQDDDATYYNIAVT
ncbi:hypothetical protein XM53_22185 [Roseovarius atlanticus]|uniref:DUF6916 domain-containing protein n=1 Tax=Roseovarius atlanticus TaxID=1641875 RepID=A0A0T5NNQ3_9RHOB|nr:hypothetical protein [Roseovarius atlanticus]KRS10230.1 hypothetical protein XM53_22185 [Roseovarius atlanticus]